MTSHCVHGSDAAHVPAPVIDHLAYCLSHCKVLFLLANSTPAITRTTTLVPITTYDIGLIVPTDASLSMILPEADAGVTVSGPKSGGGVR